MIRKVVLLCSAASALLIALPGGHADARSPRACAGILHADAHSLWFGGATGEGEGICVVGPSDVAKVLQTCAAGKYCRVVGTIGDCKDSGECAAITDIVSVTAARLPQRR
jgi:hypothetical protein